MSQPLSRLLLPNHFITLKPPNPSPIPALFGLKFRRKVDVAVASTTGNRNPTPVIELLGWNRIVVKEQQQQQCCSIPSMARNLGLRPSPELGFLSLLFVISTALGAFLSLVIISLPTMNAFRKLAVAMDKLSKVVLEEVPATLSSFKLSGMEINDLTSQLSNLRQKISGRTSKPRSNGGRKNPIIN